jgi:hypothetical protein
MTTSKSLKGGAKKSNGHKMNCSCPICKNMSKSKKRGGESEIEDVVVEDKVNDVDNNNELLVVDGGKRKRNHLKGTKKRGNGHKMNCGCPICKNMRKSKKRGGGEDKDEVEDEVNGEDEDEVNGEDDDNVDAEDEENVPKVQDDNDDENDENIEENIDEDEIIEDQPITGGKKSRKRSSRRKGRKTKKRSSRRKGRKTKKRSSRRK